MKLSAAQGTALSVGAVLGTGVISMPSPAAEVVAVLLTIGAVNAYLAGASRLGAAPARDGALPRRLTGTPRRSLILIGAGSLAAVRTTQVAGDRRPQAGVTGRVGVRARAVRPQPQLRRHQAPPGFEREQPGVRDTGPEVVARRRLRTADRQLGELPAGSRAQRVDRGAVSPASARPGRPERAVDEHRLPG